jgi:transcriptional regulator with XRE-family HTH domain
VASLAGMTLNQSSTSQKLREIRKSKGWSLQDVESKSKGKWKAVVIGSYERSDRAISLKKAIELMAFYQVPISALFEENNVGQSNTVNQRPIVIDQRSLAISTDSNLDGVKRLIALLAARRRDWNGEVLSLRSTDLQFLSLLLNTSDQDAIDFLKNGGYLIN